MIRTIAFAFGNRSPRLAADTPASIDTRIASGPMRGSSPGAISSSFCGLKPSMTKRGCSSGKSVTVRTPSTCVPLGRITVTPEKSAPPARQPSTIAPAILPQPTSQAGVGKAGVMTSGFSGGVDQCRGNGLGRRLAAPQHELEHGVEALAFLDRCLADRLGLLEAHRLALAYHCRMTEDDQARSRPKFEMAEPQLLVDEADRFIDGGALLDAHLDVGKCQELQHLVFLPPHAAQFILRPAACGRSNDFAFACALTGPAARFEILLENLDRRAVVALIGVRLVGQFLAPLAGLAGLAGLGLAAAAAEAGLAPNSSASIRFFSASFSSRAAIAMALTASNSSRL